MCGMAILEHLAICLLFQKYTQFCLSDFLDIRHIHRVKYIEYKDIFFKLLTTIFYLLVH